MLDEKMVDGRVGGEAKGGGFAYSASPAGSEEVEQQALKGREVKQKEASLPIRRARQGLSLQTQSPLYVKEPLYGPLGHNTPLNLLVLDAANPSALEPPGSEDFVIEKTRFGSI